MNRSTRKDVLRASGAIVAASAATFAAAVAMTMSGPVFAASPEYRFEVVQVASAGPGEADVTIDLVRAADGTLVKNADLSANAERTDDRRFRVETPTAGPQTLQVSAKMPGPTRIERTFNTSIKATLFRTVRGPDKMITGTVVFDAR